jgi:N-acetylglutamate synthase-like GNAT family acetyltransferase
VEARAESEPSVTERSAAFSLRPATADDYQAMVEVLRTANMHHIPSSEMPELDWRSCCVAEVDGRVVGMAGYRILSESTAKTTLLAVLPACRGLGIGNALQAWRMTELRNRGICTLTTNADRPETIAWYKKYFGYKEIGWLPKEHEFGRADIDRWTTLQTDLREWSPGSD